jgi:hypothetical protein
MLISHKKKFVFVHIYKTAGTSVAGTFLPYSRLIDRMVFEFWFSRKAISQIIKIMGWQDHGQREFCGVEKHAKAIEIREYMGAKQYDEYFSFAFVRNPFDLVVSLYFYVRQAKSHRDHIRVNQMEFDEFVRWHLDEKPPLMLDFISDPESGERIVDYIGHFENLAQDVSHIQEKVGIEVGQIQHKNASAKRKKKNYQEYYTEETKSLVENYFKADLDAFGYTFEGVKSERKKVSENS